MALRRSLITGCFILVTILTTSNAQKPNIMDSVFGVLTEWPNPNATGNPLKNVTLSCYRNMQGFGLDLLMAKTYAREMYESSGSFRTDYDLTHNLKDPGNYWMCVHADPQQSGKEFGSLYCPTSTVVDQDYNALFMGTCFPDSCTENDVTILVFEGYQHQQQSPYYDTSVTCYRQYSLRDGDIAAIVICSVLLAAILVGTIYDVYRMIRADSSVNSDPEVNAHTEIRDHIGNEEENLIMKQHATKNPGVASKCLLTFSVLDSGRKILNTDAGRGSISCLNGIRVLSMFWIILLHSYLYLGSSPSYSENYRFITDVVYQRWTATVLWQGHLGVEGFLVLSGLLVSYLTLQQFDKCGGPGKHRWWLFYLHRYWRLTPVYAFCLMMYATLTLHMGNGVWWFSWYGAQEVCQNKWWANMLYINNLYPFPGTVSECMGWSWYLAVDMQLYVISPIFIITFYKSWRAGLGLSLGTILCSFGICAYLVTVQGMPAGLDQKPYRSPKYDPATGDWIYGKPYYRIPQYLVGVGLGYVLFILKGNTVRINKILNLCIWCVAAAIALAVVYGVYPTVTGHRLPQFAAVIYNVLHRFAFSVSIGWVIFACATGNGGPVNALLSWSFWRPLAKINYCAYLVHLGVIFLYTFGFQSLWYYTDFHFAVEYLGVLVISYAVAFITTMAVEFPMIGLERVLLPSKSKNS